MTACRIGANARVESGLDSMVASSLRIVVADDDAIVLAGIETLLETVEGIDVVGSGASLAEVFDVVSSLGPDVVVTDIRMPPNGSDEGVVVAQRLRETDPDIGVVVLSQYVSPDLALSVLGDGSRRRGYMLKDNVANVEHLAQAIRTVADGGSFIDPIVLDALVEGRSTGRMAVAQLSARELEVLTLMSEGLSNIAIAERMFVGRRAVEKHIASIFIKLDLTTDTQRNRRVLAVLLFLDHIEHSPSTGV